MVMKFYYFVFSLQLKVTKEIIGGMLAAALEQALFWWKIKMMLR